MLGGLLLLVSVTLYGRVPVGMFWGLYVLGAFMAYRIFTVPVPADLSDAAIQRYRKRFNLAFVAFVILQPLTLAWFTGASMVLAAEVSAAGVASLAIVTLLYRARRLRASR